MKRRLAAVVPALAVLAGACGFESKLNSPLSPSGTLSGTPASNGPAPNAPAPSAPAPSAPAPSAPAPSTPLPGSVLGFWSSLAADPGATCPIFEWEITSQTADSISGHFSVACIGGVTIEGTASGELDGNTALIQASGSAGFEGLPPCSFSLSSTATIDGDTLTVPYTGTTCLGPISGTQVLRKRPDPPPPPPPAPPPPEPPPVNPNHVGPGPLSAARASEVVFATGDEFPNLTAPKTTESASLDASLELLRRMIWHLQLAGFQAGRQRNPSGAISLDKLTVFADGTWRSYDVFIGLGTPGVPITVHFMEVFPANHLADGGIPD